MTRDEAVKTFWRITKAANPEMYKSDQPVTAWVEGYVDGFIALGMLKVGERPPSLAKELADDLNGRLAKIPFDPKYLEFALDDLGFKLVKK